MDSADEKVIGKRLQEIAKNATTGGLYTQVGELYGFPIKVVSERILKEGLEFTDNRFVVEGNYKYTYNNGHLAMADPMAAARNFLNAMERIPSIIDQYKAKNEVLEREIPQLQEIAGKVWKKEDELCLLYTSICTRARPQVSPGTCAGCSTRISITGSPCVCIREQSGSRERKKRLPFKRRRSVLL